MRTQAVDYEKVILKDKKVVFSHERLYKTNELKSFRKFYPAPTIVWVAILTQRSFFNR